MKLKFLKNLVLASLVFYAHASNSMDISEEEGIGKSNVKSPAALDSAFAIDEYGNVEFFGSVKGPSVCFVPIGAIIDWYRPEGVALGYPDNFVICDGSVVKDEESPFYKKNVPDLIDRFILGVTDYKKIGAIGDNKGFNSTIDSTSSGKHRHGLPEVTESIARDSTPLGILEKGDYYAMDDNQRWTTGVHIRVDDGSASKYKNEGHHRHGLGGNTNDAGEHVHKVTVEVTKEQMMPSYFGLLKLIRIK